MPDQVIKTTALEDPKDLYSQACQLARSMQDSDLQILKARLTDRAFLAKLDSAEAYEGQAIRLRVAGVLQIISENPSPSAQKVLLLLTTSPAFLEHRSRVDLLIQALVQIRPAPQQAVVFWDQHFQPEDGYSGVTVWALLDNGSRRRCWTYGSRRPNVNIGLRPVFFSIATIFHCSRPASGCWPVDLRNHIVFCWWMFCSTTSQMIGMARAIGISLLRGQRPQRRLWNNFVWWGRRWRASPSPGFNRRRLGW